MTTFDWLTLAVLAVAALLIIIDGVRGLSQRSLEPDELEPWIQVRLPDDRDS